MATERLDERGKAVSKEDVSGFGALPLPARTPLSGYLYISSMRSAYF
jgi:hypothetical protein